VSFHSKKLRIVLSYSKRKEKNSFVIMYELVVKPRDARKNY